MNRSRHDGTKLEPPVCDDRPIWDLFLSMLWLPSVTAADDAGMFAALAGQPATREELAERLGLEPRAVRALLPMLASLGFVVQHAGRYHLNALSRAYLLPESPFYWGPLLREMRQRTGMHERIRGALLRKETVGGSFHGEERPPAEAWESGQLSAEQARSIAAFMHSHSLPAAVGAARSGVLADVARLLDVGGGSGCFSIALARQRTDVRCTVMELPAMVELARGYIADAGVGERVDAQAVDMFREPWPRGYDGVFFSNIFHDWSFETCAQLAAKAFAALAPGGRVFLHEMLLDDTGAAPRTAAAFSMLMLLGTRGQQFTFAELRELLGGAGFVDVQVTPTYGYYSIVSGSRPR